MKETPNKYQYILCFSRNLKCLIRICTRILAGELANYRRAVKRTNFGYDFSRYEV